MTPKNEDYQLTEDQTDIQIPFYDASEISPKKDKRFFSSREHSVKLGEIKSKSQTPGGSQKIIELHLMKSNRTISDKKMNKSSPFEPNGDQKKNINFDLVSLPDQKDLCGSWRLLMNNESPLYSQRNLLKKEFKSQRIVEYVNNKPEDFIDQKQKQSISDPMRLKLIAIEDPNLVMGRSSMVFHMENEQGKRIQVTNETQNEFFHTVYKEIMAKQGEPNVQSQTEFNFGFDPKEAMVLLNRSFKIETDSIKIESLPQSQKEIENQRLFRSGSRGQQVKNFIPGLSRKGTIKAYNKMQTHKNSLVERKKSFQSSTVAQRLQSLQLSTTRASDFPQQKNPFLMAAEKEEEAEDTPERCRIYTKHTMDEGLSLYSDEEEEDEEEEGKEKEIQVKMEIEVRRELWISLRMGPVLSYAEKIRENLEDRGFEIKFIEDMEKIQNDKEEILEKNEQLKLDIKRRETEQPRRKTSILKTLKTQKSKKFEQPFNRLATMIQGEKKKESLIPDNWGPPLPEEDMDVVYYDVKKEKKNGMISSLTYKEVDFFGEEEEQIEQKGGSHLDLQKEDEFLNEKSLGAKIMNFHNLLVEMTDSDSEYIKQFEIEKNYQQMMNQNDRVTEKEETVPKSDNYYSTNTPKSNLYSTNNMDTNKGSTGNDMLVNYMTSGSGNKMEQNFRSVSQVERDKEYDRLFSHLEVNEEEVNGGGEVRILFITQVYKNS